MPGGVSRTGKEPGPPVQPPLLPGCAARVPDAGPGPGVKLCQHRGVRRERPGTAGVVFSFPGCSVQVTALLWMGFEVLIEARIPF